MYVNPLYNVKLGLSVVPSIPGPANLYADVPLAVTVYVIVGPPEAIVILPSASLVVSIPLPPINLMPSSFVIVLNVESSAPTVNEKLSFVDAQILPFQNTNCCSELL